MAWIVTDKDGRSWLYRSRPKKYDIGYGDGYAVTCISKDPVMESLFEGFQFPKWEDEPIEIKITNNFILLS